MKHHAAARTSARGAAAAFGKRAFPRYTAGMAAIRLQDVTKQFGGQIVLHEVTLDLYPGHIAALVGANGSGKTTLFRIMAGELAPDTGTLSVARGTELGYLPQEPDLPPQATLRAVVAEAFADLLALEQKLQALGQQIADEHDAPHAAELLAQYDKLAARFDAAGGYTFEQRLSEVLSGLGFSAADCDLPVAALSGGQKCRAALARLLLQDAQFLLLDEPTNHLDIDAVRWLEKFLAGHRGGAVIISHDRYLLDRVAERVIEIDGGRVRSYNGNYTTYTETRALERLTQERQFAQDQAFLAKERDYIARYGAGQRARQARGRQTRLARRLAEGEFATARPGERRTVRLDFGDAPARGAAGKELVRVTGLTKRYGTKTLFSDLSLSVHAGERLGITGPNGTGKTTLLRIILGRVPPDAGAVYVNPAARVGFFAQDAEDLDPQRTVVEEICAVRGDFLERDARHYAARFLFTGDDPFKRIGQLSGGEQSRVRFMKLMLAAPELLILDEPTNHLDIPSREVLEEALDDFPGTIVTVSHDRYFLDRVVERLLVLRPGDARLCAGNYTDYIAQIEQERAAAEAAQEAVRATERAAARRAAARRTAAAGAPARPADPRRVSPLARCTLAELEALITVKTARLAAVEARFGDPAVCRDPARLAELRAEYEALRAEIQDAEHWWLEKADEA